MNGERQLGFRARLGEASLADVLTTQARWLLWCAVVLTLTTPKIQVGTLHVSMGDLIGASACLCWLFGCILAPSRRIRLEAAVWPTVIITVAAASLTSSLDPRASMLGLLELVVLWLLPAVSIPNIVPTPDRVVGVLLCVSLGTLVAGATNIVQALVVESGDGALPQVWGAVQYYQGYFQAVGLVIAVSYLLVAVTARRVLAVLFWCVACVLHTSALVLTQTRGAWLAALAAVITLGLVWRKGVLIGTMFVLGGLGLAVWGGDWAAAVRERVQSIFSLEAGLSGFESSLGRLALSVTAWRMFLSHPLLGVGLKNFADAMPSFAPAGMPLAYEMGAGHELTAVEGPHSTYLSLLAEVGAIGAIALVCWEFGALWRSYRATRTSRSHAEYADANAAVLLAGVVVVTLYNCFFEMNQSGTLVFVTLLALGGGTRWPKTAVPPPR